MTSAPQHLSHTVMRRVRRIHVMRTTAPVLSAAAVFMVALWGIGREVWVAKVFENMPSIANVPGVALFYFRAFLATDIFVQALSLVAVAALVWLAREIALRSVPRLASV